MAMIEANLAQKIKQIIQEIRTEETDPDSSMNIFANRLAQEIIAEVRKMTIIASAPNGPVTILNIQ